MKLQFIFTNIFIWAKLCIVMKRFSLERNWLPCQSNADDSARKHMKTFLWLQIATLHAFDGGLVGFLIQRRCKISLSLFLMWNNWWEPPWGRSPIFFRQTVAIFSQKMVIFQVNESPKMVTISVKEQVIFLVIAEIVKFLSHYCHLFWWQYCLQIWWRIFHRKWWLSKWIKVTGKKSGERKGDVWGEC